MKIIWVMCLLFSFWLGTVIDNPTGMVAVAAAKNQVTFTWQNIQSLPNCGKTVQTNCFNGVEIWDATTNIRVAVLYPVTVTWTGGTTQHLYKARSVGKNASGALVYTIFVDAIKNY